MKLTNKNKQYVITFIGILVAIFIGKYAFQMYQMYQNNNSLGRHYFIDITNVPEYMINDHELLKSKCSELLEEFQMKTLGVNEHAFQPHGYTLLFLLSESHLSLHSWPEYNTLKMDLFTCSSKKLDNVQSIKEIFGSLGNVRVTQYMR